MAKKRTTKSNGKSKRGKKGGASMMAKGAGLLAGGAVGLAAGAILVDQERREKLVKTVGSLATRAADVVEVVTDDAQSLRERAYQSLEGPHEDADKTIKKVRKATRKS